ncbi:MULTISPECIES: V-type ATP synthase subunit D [unclassified Fusibacter]|uniref:V-type ATP synthase subunit D n=1 Tax=unclassified Fusibacter TaxID=2624464 RepID=UPI0010130F96|nr:MULTISPECIES: V-type ATP synthase subunit D [unclassified Fusibacter]MCK8059885.1 V-type ATP synthase subunit D [Fusibacter sp. A2]NPE21687.1 V-type ATP synthase subunit D [Fusibacter sp. A1]RXV62090.1 V-type ATP synthase subunit D [Fusibacter sp. A1]
MKPVATKANLIKSKNMLSFSQRGFELLDKKRNVLIREMMELMGHAKNIEAEIATLYSQAYRALEYVNITMGTDAVIDIARAIPKERDFEVRLKSVMGVELPQIIYKEQKVEASYGFFRSNPSLDIAVSSFNKVKYLSYELAQAENAIFKLAMEIKKTQKRANSLEKIQIPKFREYVKSITNELEEKEREDFFRLKRVKSKQKR